jgi:SAM-dependent methyltransferase
VINLAPDKPAVFREMFRVLKPGGRVAVSDMATRKPLPREIGDDILAYVGCIAGAVKIEDYEQQLRAAGFGAVQIVDTRKDLNAYSQIESQSACCAPVAVSSGLPMAGASSQEPDSLHQRLAALLQKYDINEYLASVQVYAVKDK